MNRDKDFHKKNDGIIVNTNTKDFKRARNRNRVMKEHDSAFSKDGIIDSLNKKITLLDKEVSSDQVGNLDRKVNRLMERSDKDRDPKRKINIDMINMKRKVSKIESNIDDIKAMLLTLMDGDK